MIYVTCDYCQQDLTEPGGLIFSPPLKLPDACVGLVGSGGLVVLKRHICVKCWDKLGLALGLDL